MYETNFATAFEMKYFFCENIFCLRFGDKKTETQLEFWKRLVRASTKDEGKYSLRHPALMVAACSSPPPNITCVQLSNDSISTPNPERVAWYACTYSLSISPAASWKLTEELEELNDPTSVCKIRVEVSNLVFKEFVTDLEELKKRKNDDSLWISSSHKQIKGRDEMRGFIDAFKYITRTCHTYVTPQTAERIWFDLITKSRHGKNAFMMELPFLIRIACNVPKSMEHYVLLSSKENISTIQSFPDMDPDSFIGLYSGWLVLNCYTKKDSTLPLVNRELWLDIPSDFSELEYHNPGCVLSLSIQHLKFVTTVSEEMIRCFIPAKKNREYAVFSWFNPYLNIFNNL